MRTLPFMVLALSLAFGAGAHAQGVTGGVNAATTAVGTINAATAQYKYPLSKFVATPGPLVLRDSSNVAQIAVPISGRLKPKSMALTLTFSSSIALKPETSVLSIRFNETTLAQIRLDSRSPVTTARINLPVELARAGYNTISLAVSQHNGDSCEDPEAPELWTEINTAESSLEIAGDITSAPLHLSDMDQIFSPGIGGARRLAVVTPPLKADAALVEAGGLVAQAVALRAQYETVNLQSVIIGETGADQDAWMLDDQVVIGTRDKIAAYLEPGEADKVAGPYLSLHTLDHRQVRLVVTGRTPQDVIVAARALTYMDIPITDAVSAAIRGVKEPASARARTLQPERIYGFEELGLPTTTLSGGGTQKVTVNLPLPPDLYAPEQAAADLLLDLNYGAGTGPGSVINVTINNKFLHAISLDQEGGSAYRGYRISIPLRDFVGGTNQLAFNMIMRPIRKDRCAGASGRHLAITMFGTSSIQLPGAANVAAQPDLDLMVRTGFPYAVSQQTTVWVSDAALLPAAWSFVGRLAQTSGGVLPSLQFAIGGEPPRGSAILIGEVKSLPERVFANSEQALGQIHRVPYRAFNGPQGVAAPTLGERLWPFSTRMSTRPEPRPAGDVVQENDLGDTVILTAVKADGSATGTTTVVTGATQQAIATGVNQLTSPQYWGRASGDFMLWRINEPDSVVTQRLSPRFQSNAAPAMINLRFYISQHPWWWLGGTVLVLMALSGLTVWLLARRRPPSA